MRRVSTPCRAVGSSTARCIPYKILNDDNYQGIITKQDLDDFAAIRWGGKWDEEKEKVYPIFELHLLDAVEFQLVAVEDCAVAYFFFLGSGHLGVFYAEFHHQQVDELVHFEQLLVVETLDVA